MSSRRLRAFKRWMKSQGIVYSDALEFVDSLDEGISVRALYDLKESDLIATIPKLSCLTIRTTGISSLIEVASLGGFLGLAAALMYERSLGAASPWHGYLQLLLDREPVPIVWTSEEVDKLLVGTELYKTVKQDKKFLYEDWKEHIEPLIQSGTLEINKDSFGIEKYISAKSLIASRCFDIDDYHGSGMVPLADLFNHKTGAENVHFTIPASSSSDDEVIGDIFNVSDDEKDSVENLTNTLVSGTCEALEMIVVKEVEAGAEVFNTYGSMGNAALLHRYGFTEPDNPFNIVNIDLDLVLSWCSSSFSNRYGRTRLSLWRKLNYSGCASQDSEYFEISSDGRPQIELLILLHIIFLSENIFQKLYFAIDSLTKACEADRLIKLLELNQTDYEHKSEKALLTKNVCHALVSLADIRESLYGCSSLKEDISRRHNCCRLRESKLYHSLVLRVDERKILGKVRTYAWKHLCSMKRSCGRKTSRNF